LTVHLSRGNVRVGTIAVVDSGADFCLFPSSWATELGIQIPNVRWSEFRDATGNLRTAYFDIIELSIVDPYTHEDAFSFRADVGFSAELEQDGVAYLGHHGFFSNCQVSFSYAEGFFEITP
jgi:hypothetical protein